MNNSNSSSANNKTSTTTTTTNNNNNNILPNKKSKYSDPEFTKDFDNSKYTKDIPDEELDKYTYQDYLDYEKKMDIHLLCQISEQRCRPFFCSFESCFKRNSNMEKCNRLYRLMNMCIDKERKKVIYEFIKTGIQPKT